MLKKKTTLFTAFSQYTIDEQIGQGGNGTVFLVHNEDNESFALKALDRDKANSEKLKRFKNEIAFCENYSNKNIIKILDHGTYTRDDKNIVFYIMPVFNKTLRGLMDDEIAPDDTLSIITQILSGLKFAHEKGVWHRDIKPENILIDGQGNAVIADFGIAHFSSDNLITLVETKLSNRLANFQYAAPEQRIRGSVVDGRADIYAVGLIINEMFTHILPLGSNYKKIGDVNPEFAWLDSVVDSMLQQNPDDRPYPASSVATHILVAQENWIQSKELLLLAEEEEENNEPYQMEVPTIRDYTYGEGELKVYLDGIDPYWFEKWFSILQLGRYSHSATLGFETTRLRKYLPDCIAMPISATSPWGYNLKNIAQYMKSWIIDATKLFNIEQRNKYNEEENARRQKKEAEIKRLNKEAEMREAVKGIFD